MISNFSYINLTFKVKYWHDMRFIGFFKSRLYFLLVWIFFIYLFFFFFFFTYNWSNLLVDMCVIMKKLIFTLRSFVMSEINYDPNKCWFYFFKLFFFFFQVQGGNKWFTYIFQCHHRARGKSKRQKLIPCCLLGPVFQILVICLTDLFNQKFRRISVIKVC